MTDRTGPRDGFDVLVWALAADRFPRVDRKPSRPPARYIDGEVLVPVPVEGCRGCGFYGGRHTSGCRVG